MPWVRCVRLSFYKLKGDTALTGPDVVRRLQEMHTEVQREMPHIGCDVVVHPGLLRVVEPCTCYKRDLLQAIRDSEMLVRDSLGMPPF